jgi:hypothetical protein
MKDLASLDPEAIKEAQLQGKRGLPWMDDTELDRDEDFEIAPNKGKVGFWGEGQEELGPDEDYYADDITSHGHGQLEEHRELREYARLIAWELPLLNGTSTFTSRDTSLQDNANLMSRSRAAVRASHSSDTIPLPLHILPWRATPRNQQGSRRILCIRHEKPYAPPTR